MTNSSVLSNVLITLSELKSGIPAPPQVVIQSSILILQIDTRSRNRVSVREVLRQQYKLFTGNNAVMGSHIRKKKIHFVCKLVHSQMLKLQLTPPAAAGIAVMLYTLSVGQEEH